MNQDELYRKYSAALDKALAKAEPGMRRLFDGLNRVSAMNMRMDLRDEAISYMQAMVTTLSRMTSFLAKEYFDQAHTVHTGKYQQDAKMADDPDPKKVEADVRYSARCLFQEEPNADAFIKSCTAQAQRHAMASANQTVIDNCRKKKVRYARVPTSPHPCDFCLMLASRGFVYATRETAGELGQYHNHCRCRIVPGFGKNPTLKGYDPDALYEEWQERRSADATKRVLLRTHDDPLREFIGSAEQSDPKRTAEIFADLRNKGFEIIRREGRAAIAYGPSPHPGKPGQLIFSPGASIAALEHEYDHALTDLKLGFPGSMHYFANRKLRIKMEKQAYEREMDVVREKGYDQLVNRYQQLLEEEIKRCQK